MEISQKLEANDLAVFAQTALIFGAVSLFIGIALVLKTLDFNNSTPEKGGGFLLAGVLLLAISIILGFWAFAKKNDQKNRLILTLFISFFLLALMGFLFLR